jgi:hypothetical protein
MLGLPNLGMWNDFWYMIPVLRFGRRDNWLAAGRITISLM